MLPCEFCNQQFPFEAILLHQVFQQTFYFNCLKFKKLLILVRMPKEPWKFFLTLKFF
jgi:hypothetical protein